MAPEPAPALGCVRIWYPRVGSTMDVAMALGVDGAPHGTLVEAGEQTAGRGRLGRRWMAPPGSAFLGSWLLRVPQGVELAALSPAVAAAVMRAISALAPDAPVTYKWPNDVLIDGRKVAGILLTGRAMAGETIVIAGTGINVALASVPPDVPATCLTEWASVTITDVRDRLVAELDAVVPGALAGRGLPAAERELLEARMALRGEPVEVLLPDEAITGIAAGLMPDGGLRLRSLDGRSTRVLHVGEIARGPRGAAGTESQTAVYFQDNGVR